MIIMLCKDRAESILTGVYDAWAHEQKNCDIRLEIERADFQPELFCEYMNIEESFEKAEKVVRSIRKKLSDGVWHQVYGALRCDSPDKADAVFRFLIQAFRRGPKVLDDLADPAVMRVFELDRQVGRECQLMYGFVRFAALPSGVLLAKIAPKHHQLPSLAAHFAERLNTERFVIYDEKRKQAAVYAPGQAWYLIEEESDELDVLIRKSEEDGYADLWRVFFETIAIKERENYRCQRNHMPLYLRTNMTEFLASRQSGGEAVLTDTISKPDYMLMGN